MTQFGEGVAVTTIPEDPEETKEKKKIKVRMSVFFDGTLNNRNNTQARESDSSVYKDNYKKTEDTSYENDESNIAIMEAYVDKSQDYEHSLNTYIEGAGTIDDKGDKTFGAGLGIGKAGVEAKVKKGLQRVNKKIDQTVDGDNEIIEQLILDVFGFSRGAATARYFIHKSLTATPLKTSLTNLEIEVQKVEVKFAGLYDTVASHGVDFIFGANDTKTLKLDAVSQAEKTIHLVASEEHRENFSVTDIESAGSKGKTVYLPGVHADIGGSYRDGASEGVKVKGKPVDGMVINRSMTRTKLDKERERLIAAGWYREDEIWVEEPDINDYDHNPQFQQSRLKVRRTGIKNQYSRIPLHIMADFAKESGIVLKNDIDQKEAVSPDLAGLHKRLKSEAKKGGSKVEDWQHNEPWLCELRHDHLHFSAHYDTIGMAPSFIEGTRKRKVLGG